MRSSKNRSRSKSNRQRSIGNIINRVFDSSGPEGKVRGTPQQIIEKYLMLARDAGLSNDRVAEQNFLQHAEHYTRMLGEAQAELAREQAQRQAQGGQPYGGGQQQGGGMNGQGGNGGGYDRGRERYEPRERDEEGESVMAPGPALSDDVPDTLPAFLRAPAEAAREMAGDDDPFGAAGSAGLVETPEMRVEGVNQRRRDGDRRPRGEAQPPSPPQPSRAEGEAPRGPRRGPRPRRDAAPSGDAPAGEAE
ncbi:MAG: DUF4167 domain-containing protein [Rhodobacteraceae bacterium]|nr:DUF4167 domain-containing protein [Paracoccaceae bacterium]